MNSALYTCYSTLESRLGYRHFGYWEHDTKWPFPIKNALRRMEEHLFESLNVSNGEVLDAGCGDGHVAIYMSKQGLKVRCIDLIDHHLNNTRKNLRAQGLNVSVEKGDYHNLNFPSVSLDGVYTMETLVHSTDPKQALAEFFRVLRPGGRIALYEYDHLDNLPKQVSTSLASINQYAAVPANRGVLQSLLTEAGFEEVELKDLSYHIKPMLRMFYYLAFIPYNFVMLFGFQMWFINVIAGVESCRGQEHWSYVAITASKPRKQRTE